MFSDFPNLHPLVVHVPIVLILLGAALQAVLVFKDWQQVRWGTLLVLAGGFAGALAASTVFHAEPAGLGRRAAAVFAAHEKYASYTLWLSGITLLLRGVGDFFKIQRRAYEILVLAFALAAAGVLSVAGHRGAQLVYVEGVGPQGHLLSKHHGHDEDEAANMPDMPAEAEGHAETGAPADHTTQPVPTPAGQPAASAAPHAADMPGMDMGRPAASERNSPPAPTRPMGDMEMPGPKRPNQPKPASMGAMPGMQMPASGTQPMPKGMNMRQPAPAKQPQAGMADMPGMGAPATKPATAPAPSAAMDQMSGMPGMSPAAPAQPGHSVPAPAPGMKDMPGMTMSNPLDKFRFKDNNPARTQPAPKQ